MSINPVEFLGTAGEVMAEAKASMSKVPADFEGWLKTQMTEVNQQIIDSDQNLRALALGQAENLHQVMMSLEKAKLSFSLVSEVRNRLLDAYQDIMRMQI